MTKRSFLRWGALLLALLAGIVCGTVGVSAEDGLAYGAGGELPDGFQDLAEHLPEEELDRLPSGIGSSELGEIGAALGEMTAPDALLSFLSETVSLQLGSALRLFASLCGILLFSALFGALKEGLGSGMMASAFRFCTTAAVFAAIVRLQLTQMERVSEFLERLSSLMGAMIPILGTVWAMGGNVSTASAGSTVLSVFLTVCQGLCGATVVPLCCFCTAMALCGAMSPEMGVRGVSAAVKKCYTFLLGLIMTLLVASLGAQTALTSAADSVTARTAKLVSSTVIPVVGGSVGDTLRTVASGVQYLKSVVGVTGIAFILILLLPILLSLILTRLVFLLAGGLADLLGCEGEGRLISELSQIWGCMIAVVAMSSVMFILALWIFVSSVVAVR